MTKRNVTPFAVANGVTAGDGPIDRDRLTKVGAAIVAMGVAAIANGDDDDEIRANTDDDVAARIRAHGAWAEYVGRVLALVESQRRHDDAFDAEIALWSAIETVVAEYDDAGAR
jgi:hypothetical protein